MSAIGGIVDFKNDEVDFARLNRMRLSMSLRGRKRSSAFLCGGVGMIFNSHREEKDGERQPCINERRGQVSALCIDGEGFSAPSLLERYSVHGLELLGMLEGAFSLALYDGEREMLILARDKKGRKPLFYRVYENKIFFASEVKGLLDAVNGSVRVNKEILELHLTSPAGIYRASNIYSEISEVMAGECLLFTRLGVSKFFYRQSRDSRPIKAQKNEATPLNKSPKIFSAYRLADPCMTEEYLREALIAFDYPQFDCYMSSLMLMLDTAAGQEKKTVHFEDAMRRKNLSYAHEREDRLGALYGLEAIGTLPRVAEWGDIDNIIKTEERLAFSVLSMNESEREILKAVFGEHKLYTLLRFFEKRSIKKEDTEQRVRILGMLYQTVEWFESRAVILDDSRKIYCEQSL